MFCVVFVSCVLFGYWKQEEIMVSSLHVFGELLLLGGGTDYGSLIEDLWWITIKIPFQACRQEEGFVFLEHLQFTYLLQQLYVSYSYVTACMFLIICVHIY